MNILGVDYGTKRIGLAWVQQGLDVVLPFGVIEGEDRVANIEEVISVIEQEDIQKVVLGLPFGPDGEETENTKRVRAFGDEITSRSGLHIEFIGEEFTTKEAEAMGGDASLDEKSAMLILKSYLGA